MGLLLAAVVNNSTHLRDDTGSYRIPIAVQFAWSLVLFIGMIVLPETPRFLIKSGHMDKAATALGKLRRLAPDHPAVADELGEIKANHDYETRIGKASYLACFKPPILKRQLTGMALQALQQATGVNFVFYFGPSYFRSSGISNEFTVQLIMTVVNVVMTIPGLYAIDKFGRRPLLLWGAVAMTISQFLVACLGTFTTSQDAEGNIIVHSVAAQRAGIAFISCYIAAFASCWGPLPWYVLPEQALQLQKLIGIL